ncbi:MAG: hypothetical protein NTY90_05350 [Candidatus Micrarchaeota archaeon]|nr:hypothetical protein [Candidatus Micrarchaeota archaeon]
MPDMELPYGPWTRILSAQWGEYPLSIYHNPDKVILLVIFDKTDGDTNGVLVVMKKAFLAEGDLTKFILAQKKEMVFLEKFSKEARHSFLLVGPVPAYVAYSQDQLLDAVKKQYSEIDAISRLTKDVVAGYGAKATDLAQAGEEAVQVLLGDPLTLFALARPERPAETVFPFAKIMLGIDSKGDAVEAKLASLGSVGVVGGKKSERLHTLHVLAEEALQNNVACLVLDSTDSFQGLKEPSKETAALEKFHVHPIPVGYPLKTYELGTNTFLDLSTVSPDAFLSAFGLEQSDTGALVKKVMDLKKAQGLGDLMAEIAALKESKENPQYAINKAVRVIQVIQKTHPALFAKNLSQEWLAPWQEGAAKVFHISLSKQPQNVRQLFIQSLLRSMPLPEGRVMKLFIVFEQDISDISDDVAIMLEKFRKSGVGFAVQSEHEVDVEMVPEPSLKIEFTNSEAAVTEAGERPKRFTVRPGLTVCSEAKAG